MKHMKALVCSTAILLTVVSVASCSKKGGTTGPSGSNPLTISILGQRGNLSFSPNPADAGGKVVVFKNNDVEAHRVVLNDGSIDTGDIAPGATSRSVTMPSNGTNYHCSTHPGNMGGAIEAQGGGTPPPCQGDYCY